MHLNPIATRRLTVRFAQTQEEVRAAQKLRWKVFCKELDVQSSKHDHDILDCDIYDQWCDHLLVVDEGLECSSQIVGTYRLLRQSRLPSGQSFYTAQEFDLDPVLVQNVHKGELLELGRACVLPAYRTSATIALLWRGIADYIAAHNIGLMFGCASFQGADPVRHALGLSYLWHRHMAPASFRPKAIGAGAINEPVLAEGSYDERAALMTLPPLIKGYLRTGAMVGEGAFVDYEFQTVDICILMPVGLIAERYLSKFSVAA